MIEIQTVNNLKALVVVPGSDTLTQRVLIAAALGQGRFRITGKYRMTERPIEPLIHALRG